MKITAAASIPIVLLALASAPAHAVKPCEELKSEIAAQLDAKHVVNYMLDIVPADKPVEGDGKVVGTCDGGKNKIVYTRK
ncbi:MAG TPA: DUF1161 domain-containing protein [Burkholderiaceae bacterium]|nr:DUF1161 domain-containing protein [Burkholderiaceae bacterium]